MAAAWMAPRMQDGLMSGQPENTPLHPFPSLTPSADLWSWPGCKAVQGEELAVMRHRRGHVRQQGRTQLPLLTPSDAGLPGEGVVVRGEQGAAACGSGRWRLGEARGK